MKNCNSNCCPCSRCKKFQEVIPSESKFEDGDAKVLAEINEVGHVVLKQGVMNLGTALELVDWISEVVSKGVVKW